jgi:hypothetical protein
MVVKTKPKLSKYNKQHPLIKQLIGDNHTKVEKWEQVGVVGVDAGCILLGDPSYWMSGKDYDKLICNGWSESLQINYDLGHAGKGVVVSSGFGDGCYPVYVKKQHGRVKEVRIKFF